MKKRSQHSRIRSMQRQHRAIKFQQSALVAKIDNRRRAADYRDCKNPRPHRVRCRVGIRRPTRDCQNAKLINPKMVDELFQDQGPIGQLAIRLQRGFADSGAIRRNNADTKIARRLIS